MRRNREHPADSPPHPIDIRLLARRRRSTATAAATFGGQEAVVDVLVKLSRLALDNESIEEIEINPLRVLGKGAVAVDVRMKRK